MWCLNTKKGTEGTYEMTFSDFALETRQQSWKQEGEVLQIIQEVLDLHFSLFRHPFTLELTEDNKLQRVWLALTTSAFHSLRIGYDALESGCYSQCFTLTRVALEDWLVAVDCQSHSETIEALLDSKRRFPAFKRMAKRLPEELKVHWEEIGDNEGNYGFLSTFAHPRQRALQATVNFSGTILIVPEYDAIWFTLASNLLLEVTLLMLSFVEKLADFLGTPASQEWQSQNLKEVKPKGFATFDSLQKRIMSYSQQPERE